MDCPLDKPIIQGKVFERTERMTLYIRRRDDVTIYVYGEIMVHVYDGESEPAHVRNWNHGYGKIPKHLIEEHNRRIWEKI